MSNLPEARQTKRFLLLPALTIAFAAIGLVMVSAGFFGGSWFLFGKWLFMTPVFALVFCSLPLILGALSATDPEGREKDVFGFILISIMVIAIASSPFVSYHLVMKKASWEQAHR